MKKNPEISLLALDIDNTLFDWVTYYSKAFGAALHEVARVTGASYAKLASEAKEVFTHRKSIEHPFVIQELPSVQAYYGDCLTSLLDGAVHAGKSAFSEAAKPYLKPYPGVEASLAKMVARQPNLRIVALTDAPRYVAMWKLNKLGLLSYMDAVYGLSDPQLPVKNGEVLVRQEILVKHHSNSNFGFGGTIRTLPEDYEKPGVKGLKTVLMDYNLDLSSHEDLEEVLWVGDNLRKDVALGKSLKVRTAWASYGTKINKDHKDALMEFSPEINVQKNVALDPGGPDSPVPDLVLDAFEDLLTAF